MNEAKQMFLYTMTALRLFSVNAIFSRANQALSVSFVVFLFWGTLFGYLLTTPAINKKIENQYIPIDDMGRPIIAVRGSLPFASEDEVYTFVKECMGLALSLSQGNFRREYMRFTSKCMAPSDAVAWGNELNKAGFFDLIKTGSLLRFIPEEITLKESMVQLGRYMWLFEVRGPLERVFLGGTDSAEILIRVVVTRQDPFNYEKGISIKQVIL